MSFYYVISNLVKPFTIMYNADIKEEVIDDENEEMNVGKDMTGEEEGEKTGEEEGEKMGDEDGEEEGEKMGEEEEVADRNEEKAKENELCRNVAAIEMVQESKGKGKGKLQEKGRKVVDGEKGKVVDVKEKEVVEGLVEGGSVLVGNGALKGKGNSSVKRATADRSNAKRSRKDAGDNDDSDKDDDDRDDRDDGNDGRKRFDCDQCPRSYMTPQNLSRHKAKLHDNEKIRFTCKDQYCKKTFTEKSDMNRHLVNVHKLEPYPVNLKREDVASYLKVLRDDDEKKKNKISME